MSFAENLEIDADPLPERLYNVKGDHRCAKCDRLLKGKTAYLNFKNKLICKDTGSKNPPIEAILCATFTALNTVMATHGLKLPKSAMRRIDRILRDALEQ